MAKYVILIGLATVMALLLHSCIDNLSCVEGNGEVTEQERDLSGFDEIVLEGSANLIISQGSPYRVLVETDENLLSNVETYISGTKLVIDTKSSLCPTVLNIYISMEDISDLNLDGSGNVYFETPINTNSLDIDIDGSGDIVFKDTVNADKFDLSIGGSGDINSAMIIATNLSLLIDGSGDIELEEVALENISIEIEGSGDVYAAGNAVNSFLRIDGSGNIDLLYLETKNTDAMINGSGDMRVWVTDYLKARIYGSGDIFYKGSPDIDSDLDGSGDLRKIY